MTSDNTRDAIADAMNDALDDGSGAHVTSYYRQTLRPGEGFVRLGQRTRDGSGLGFMDTWEVWICVPQDTVTGEQWLDNKIDGLIAGFSREAVVTTITPSQLALGGPNTVNGVILTGVRES